MGDPESREKHSRRRKNFFAKELQKKIYHEKTHSLDKYEKSKERQRRILLDEDEEFGEFD